ncbi:hypothetical protein PF005_g4422 [Phytophthora fragariae]|uniref:Uncharacterized protein n=1 Tax=Phytophthora fragariae TaxID=53985 RepID=A0A6A3TVM4_9STRA|nr:hypothetical protein PF003_g5318 [Phytophthora fragariae]KAE9137937.1 hypothetical protein PF007_g1613 [Phytophthora fragariae]KAE9151435.1 hypothetical protein PF006_g4266 [Phytophthora fragariae]KAE9228158.1 hypothetical protein PF005_g4422 [Phytophthora fragariae]KAE9256238.1 hypothetical protein PF002_g1976 [Phytophthora fragariae]
MAIAVQPTSDVSNRTDAAHLVALELGGGGIVVWWLATPAAFDVGQRHLAKSSQAHSGPEFQATSHQDEFCGATLGSKNLDSRRIKPREKRPGTAAPVLSPLSSGNQTQTRRAPRTHSRHTTQERLERASRLLPALCI